ncbi:nuclear transport factor 2 family protein [Aureimonas populi]|uniref:Nuclear transport factor 2 family protein n=1 Tax=Aureimonas populi TaxID=1701758 RepID=A0ABW5CH45_9HYPH|nr:nuclear transport factor 2 family protein [Aureimonas populi]
MSLEATVARLSTELAALRAEADIRRLIARYAYLCDTPLPVPRAQWRERVEMIVDLFTADATWEGVGSFYDNQFGKSRGKDAIRAHFTAFFEPKENELVLNCHYITSEHIEVRGDEAEGSWVHFQPWIFADGRSLLRSSRLFNAFKRVDGVWKMSRYRTENVFIADLPEGWASSIPEKSVLFAPGEAAA